MEQQWRIRIREKRRKQPDKHLLLQALVALAKQMEAERQNGSPATPSEERKVP